MHHRPPFIAAALAAAATTAFGLAACGGGGGSSVVSVRNPAPSPTPIGQACDQTVASPAGRPAMLAGGFIKRLPRSEGAPSSDIVPGVLAVRLGARDDSLLARVAARAGGSVRTQLDGRNTATIAIDASVDPALAARAAAGVPGVIAAGPVIQRRALVIPNDPGFGVLPYDPTNPSTSNPPIQWDLYTMHLPDTWSLSTGFGASSVRLAIIDTGYDLHNPDLQGRVGASVVFDKGNGTADLGASVQDGDGHGTDTSGIAAADTDNGTDVAGTAGGITLLEARVFPTPSPKQTNPGASTQDVAAGIDWAVNNGADVISMSLGSSSADPTYEEPAVANAIAHGVTVVAAAGNGNANGVGQPTLDYPANDPGVIAVGASALCDGAAPRDYASATEYVASYSNYTSDASKSFVVAPGGDPSAEQVGCNSRSCIDFLQWIFNLYSTTAFGGGAQQVLIAGTSMSTPHVAAVAALMRSKNPSLTPSQIAQIIIANTININDPRQGHGRVDALQALQATP